MLDAWMKYMRAASQKRKRRITNYVLIQNQKNEMLEGGEVTGS